MQRLAAESSDDLVGERIGTEGEEELEDRRRRDGGGDVGQEVEHAEELPAADPAGSGARRRQGPAASCTGTVKTAYQTVTRRESKTSLSPWASDCGQAEDQAAEGRAKERQPSRRAKRPASRAGPAKNGRRKDRCGHRGGQAEERKRLGAEELGEIAQPQEAAPREPPLEEADIDGEEEREDAKSAMSRPEGLMKRYAVRVSRSRRADRRPRAS